MTETPALPADPLAAVADTASQRTAAVLAQDVFGEIFRHSFGDASGKLGERLKLLEIQCIQWCEQEKERGDAAQTLRLALLLHGLDQWGLAYAQAFQLNAIPALSALVGSLRGRLDARGDAIFQGFFEQIAEQEHAALDFKVALRRSIHLALWHAMSACETAAEADATIQALGSLMLAVHRQMPTVGWRLLADALAHIQIGLLANPALSDLARDSTQRLFDALLHALPKETYRDILRLSGQVTLAWQQEHREAPTA